MTREAVAQLIYWPYIMLCFAVLNPCFMLPQLIKIWETSETKGISMITLILIVLLQVGFGVHGFFIRDALIMWSNSAAACVSLLVVLSTTYFRRRDTY